MMITKLTNKSLVTNDDLAYNMRIGLPIEVFCPSAQSTIAFGRIESFTGQQVYISGAEYCREKHLLFGLPAH
ncbi:hypothetical protein ACJ2A9_10685 [Anaerobacillus sp. MEB173]|uniref:hypothetical protein n=1 Tax=Anaerobacillus sp. MEB173 TaxID=3383345 RepID=UPI003F907FF7